MGMGKKICNERKRKAHFYFAIFTQIVVSVYTHIFILWELSTIHLGLSPSPRIHNMHTLTYVQAILIKRIWARREQVKLVGMHRFKWNWWRLSRWNNVVCISSYTYLQTNDIVLSFLFLPFLLFSYLYRYRCNGRFIGLSITPVNRISIDRHFIW